ncbi:MAG TPA: FUSC family protein [Candidatus Acidoferrum sp.]|nr:FUSC family protein [Candidatus Acidoferrum sp.]
MATAAQTISSPSSPFQWLWRFLNEELSPYPGRGALVARIVVATTIMMIVTLVFRLPYGAYGAIFAMTISRENPQATLNAAQTIVFAFALSVLYVLAGALLFLADPTTRLLWVIGTFFLMFYGLRVVNNYTAAARFGYLLIITIPLWDQHISAGLRVENTLWAFGVISFASIIAALTELVYANLRPHDDLVQSIAERLAAIEDLLNCYIESRPVDAGTEKNITSLALVGTSRLRRFLQRSEYSQHFAEQMGAVVALVGRLVDIAANLSQLKIDVSDDDRLQIRELANKIAGVRAALLQRSVPGPIDMEHALHRVPLLQELNATVSLVPAVFTGSQSLSAFAPEPASGDPPTRFFVPDAFSNPEHMKFALRGCLAASLCYIIYNAKDWPDISTSVTTCFLTALSTIGSSHQKQILRIAGAIVGGLVCGIGAQIFILPYLDSVTGFTLLFLAVTIPGVWVATSGPRLSYFGVQILVAFYLINLSEFKVQTSLVLARDRVIGIFLGLLMMWLAFDRLGSSPAVLEMKKVFISNVRLLAQFAREPVSKDMKLAIERSYSLREAINKNFDSVRNLADGVLLEFGPSRQEDLALRGRILQWQPRLRALFLTRIALWKYRVQLPGFQLPPTVRVAQQEFDEESANLLDRMADRMEKKDSVQQGDLEEPFIRLERAIEKSRPEPSSEDLDEVNTFLLLLRKTEGLETSLNRSIEVEM